jgi:hypothetical protein
MPDCPRRVDLSGIVVVDVRFIAFSAPAGLEKRGVETALDLVADWLAGGLAQVKTRAPFMFAVGLGFLVRSGAGQSLTFGHLCRCRIIGLPILCTARGCFLPLWSRIRLLRQSRMTASGNAAVRPPRASNGRQGLSLFALPERHARWWRRCGGRLRSRR